MTATMIANALKVDEIAPIHRGTHSFVYHRLGKGAGVPGDGTVCGGIGLTIDMRVMDR